MATEESLKWSASLAVAPPSRTAKLPGDKILLPPSALEQLISAAPVTVTEPSRTLTSNFDPFNPYTYAAERAARAQYEERQPHLPHPLTFRLVNPDNGRVIYAGIREFSASDGEIALSPMLRDALGIKPADGRPGATDQDGGAQRSNGVDEDAAGESWGRITVHAKQLPKGTFVKLRPLEAGYDPEDWKSLLEQHLRSNFTTLTKGEVLVVPGGRGVGRRSEEYRFLVDEFKPDVEGICVVDTDLEVDIEALNEEQARETLRRIAAKSHRAPGTNNGSSIGGPLELMKAQHGQVLSGDYVDYEVPSWIRSQGIEVELSGVDDDAELDLFVSPFSPRQRVRPREEEHLFADTSSRYPKRIRIQPTNVELEHAEALYVSVHAYSPTESTSDGTVTPSPKPYTIKVSPFDPDVELNDNEGVKSEAADHPDDVQCGNCKQWVPKRTLVLHENFCLRNNVLCPKGCGQVFQKRSSEWQNHWHCEHDAAYGNTPLSKLKHNHLQHTAQTCSSCDRTYQSMSALATHRTSVCPGKIILCQFCHLEVPQEGDPEEPNAEALLSGLTPHELADGGRTTECHLCNKIVRLRDMRVHLANHELEKKSRPEPRVCRNVLCGKTLDGASHSGDTRAGTRIGNGPGNDVGLCSTCFGPLYVAMHDPDGKALRRRIERRYLTQLVTGCGKSWCKNEYCRTGRKNLGIDGSVGMKEALPMIKPLLEGLQSGDTPLHFCTDEKTQQRRGLAELLAAERGLRGEQYAFNWCVAALEAEGGMLDHAREWLKNWAPVKSQ
ncbi:uncharacterized protein PV09_01183 [Verruconis gallopava]|uniref:Uncharacterized protein n=1 Tax=Verruconis gallopava TaxID=253628 RepID=A0A0D2BAB1_9PEZI|nr:uncharacterized protein PV09_01183 [Verruconis gallopava]KIW08259.1 hypothetical protein PV09_01183 [Verruconis gallopava]